MKEVPGLVLGYRQFLRDEYQKEAERYRELAEYGQTPRTMVVACCDSRVDPSRIFSARPGELFVVRNVANLVPPFEMSGDYHGTSAALEFAIDTLHVENILVLGHARCGGVRAFLDSAEDRTKASGFSANWISLLQPAWGVVQRTSTASSSREAIERKLEQAAITHSLANLMTFPFVESAIARKELMLHGGYFDIASGQLLALDPSSRSFEPL